VLVKLDYSNQQGLPAELKTQNDFLAAQYRIREFPTVLLLDAAGQVVAKTGYRPGGPAEYLKHLGGLLEKHDAIAKMQARLTGLTGLDRAKLLDQLVDAGSKLNDESPELDGWSEEIVGLDPDNKAGLRCKHEFRLFMAGQRHEFDEMKARVDKMFRLPGLTNQQKQTAYMIEGQFCYFSWQDVVGAVENLEKAAAADPASKETAQINALLAALKPFATLAKLKVLPDEAEGVESAKNDREAEKAGKK
jgi:hypothetical protein